MQNLWLSGCVQAYRNGSQAKKKKKKDFSRVLSVRHEVKTEKFHLWCCISTFLLDQNQNNVALSLIKFSVTHIGKYLDIKLNYWGRNLQQRLYNVLLLSHCQILKGVKLYHGNLKCLPLHAHTKEKKKKKRKKNIQNSFHFNFREKPQQGFSFDKCKKTT